MSIRCRFAAGEEGKRLSPPGAKGGFIEGYPVRKGPAGAWQRRASRLPESADAWC
jgi:hypothetical protein